jgi:hypothetical protein
VPKSPSQRAGWRHGGDPFPMRLRAELIAFQTHSFALATHTSFRLHL